MRAYSDEEIARYVASGDPLDKAAAYAIQSWSFQPVARIEGCRANVMGLPLCHLYPVLQRMGLRCERSPDASCQDFTGYSCPIASQVLSDIQ